MDIKKKVNIWVGPPPGADSRARFGWQCKTLAVWIDSLEESVRECFHDLLEKEAGLLHEQLMQMSSERFGKQSHPYLDVEQMYNALYPVLVHVMDVVAALNPPMVPEREVVDKTQLFNQIRNDFLHQADKLSSRFEELLTNHGFHEAFSALCEELENIVVKSTELPEQAQSN